jgi:hypothetical protein
METERKPGLDVDPSRYVAQFEQTGYVIIENALTVEELDAFRADCDAAVSRGPPPDEIGCVVEPLARYRGDCLTVDEYVGVRGAEGLSEAIGAWILLFAAKHGCNQLGCDCVLTQRSM